MRSDTEAAWLEGLDSRTAHERSAEAVQSTPTVNLSGCGPIVDHEPPF